MVADQNGPVAQAAAAVHGGGAQLADASAQVVFHVGKGAWQRTLQKVLCLSGQAQVIALHDLQSLFFSGGIHTGRAGGDHIQPVSHHIGQNDGHHPGRRAGGAETARL